MKISNIFISTLDREIPFYIGKNARDNFEVIDNGDPEDIWFHAKNISSCHVVVELPNQHLQTHELNEIIHIGAALCKENTQKLSKLSNVSIIYTELKNVVKTKTPGLVVTKNTKIIKC